MARTVQKMKALVVYGKNDYVLEKEYPVRDLKRGEVLVRVEACGICASDIKNWHGAPGYWGDGKSGLFVKPPFIPGHEFIGEVVEVADGYEGDVRVGDRVTGEQIVPCGKCWFCRTGKYWMCEEVDMFGFRSHVNGAMAEYIILPENARIYQVPKEMPMKEAVLIEPYSCSKHAVDRASIGNTDVVVVAGAGALGLGMINYARLRNPRLLIAVDMKNDRLELARKFGADVTLNPAECDAVSEIRKLSNGGYGCDVYIEATGQPASVQQGLDAIRKLGTFVEFSIFGEKVEVDWTIIGGRKELDILGSHLGPYCYDDVIGWIADHTILTDDVVTDVFDLDHWEEAFRKSADGTESIKVVIVPQV